MKRTAVLVAALMLLPAVAQADTLYVAPPAAAAPGHPLRLGPDHRAQQVGDLIAVQFNFSITSASTDVVTQSKGYNIGLGAGTGNAALGFLRFPTGLGGQTGIQSNNSKNGSNSLVSNMMAEVTGVLPSGALQIEGDQHLIVNGQDQVMHVTGIVRPEDIDTTDTVLSTRIANVRATFNGNFQQKNEGLLRRILDVLF
ncbi:MAG: flagellar basal body L-ring protein FlgH [Vulcanimicrobiaceae bacterium]